MRTPQCVGANKKSAFNVAVASTFKQLLAALLLCRRFSLQYSCCGARQDEQRHHPGDISDGVHSVAGSLESAWTVHALRASGAQVVAPCGIPLDTAFTG